MERHSSGSLPELPYSLALVGSIRSRWPSGIGFVGFIEELVDAEINVVLGRMRYRCSVSAEAAGGYRHG